MDRESHNVQEDFIKREPDTERTIDQKHFFLNLKELTNKHIVERGLATGLIKNGESAQDVAKKLYEYDANLGKFMENVVKQNTKRKRGGIKKNAYMTGKNPYTREIEKNPEEYLKVMSEYIFSRTNSGDQKEGHQEWTETIKTLFGIQKETKIALMNVLSS